jgi:hypothetical protein
MVSATVDRGNRPPGFKASGKADAFPDAAGPVARGCTERCDALLARVEQLQSTFGSEAREPSGEHDVHRIAAIAGTVAMCLVRLSDEHLVALADRLRRG